MEIDMDVNTRAFQILIEIPKYLVIFGKQTWLAGNSRFPIRNTSSFRILHCYVSLPESIPKITQFFACSFFYQTKKNCTFKLRLTGKPTIHEDVYLDPMKTGDFPTYLVSFRRGGCTFKLAHAPKICWLETLGAFGNLHRFEPLPPKPPPTTMAWLVGKHAIFSALLPKTQEETWQKNIETNPP